MCPTAFIYRQYNLVDIKNFVDIKSPADIGNYIDIRSFVLSSKLWPDLTALYTS